MTLMEAWKTEKVYHDGARFFSALSQEIAAARHSVDVETYIFEDDEFGRQFLAELNAASARGLRVRLLIDGIGSWAWTQKLLRDPGDMRISTRVYHPVPWPFSRFLFAELPKLLRALKFFLRINRRNHRKVFLIDEQKAFVGSVNVWNESLHWRETCVCVEGPEVKQLTSSFDHAWETGFSLKQIPQRKKGLKIKRRSVPFANRLVRLNQFVKLRRKNFTQLLQQIEDAQTRLWITNPYFRPNHSLLNGICRAAQRGVDVRVLLPAKSDILIYPAVSQVYYSSLLAAGVKVYEYQPTILHAKTLIIDNTASVGSSNLNSRSRYHDLEVDVRIRKPESIHSMVTQFQQDLSNSHLLTKQDLNKLSVTAQLAARIVLLLRNWI